MSKKLVDAHFDYIAENRSEGTCRLEIYDHHQSGARIVVVTELDDNEGASVTNAAEAIATQVAQVHGDFHFWIEHYEGKEDAYDLVSFRYDRVQKKYEHPEWISISEAHFLEMLGLKEPSV